MILESSYHTWCLESRPARSCYVREKDTLNEAAQLNKVLTLTKAPILERLFSPTESAPTTTVAQVYRRLDARDGPPRKQLL